MFPDRIYGMHDHVAVSFKHFIIVFGGKDTRSGRGGLPHHEIWLYNLYTELWRIHVMPVGELAPPPTRKACAVVAGENIYMFGGNNKTLYTNALWKLTITPGRYFVWDQIIIENQEKTPSPRGSHSAWGHAGKVWIFGGYGPVPNGYLNDHGDFISDGIGGFRMNNQLFCFDPSDQEWKNIQSSGAVPGPRLGQAVTMTDDKVWLFGGQNMTYFGLLDELYMLDMPSLTWTEIQTSQMKPERRVLCSLNAVANDQLVLYGGGTAQSNQCNTWIFDILSLI